MPLDAIFLSAVVKELTGRIIDAKIDKIYQPTKTDVVLQLRSREGNVKMLLSANSNSPRVHLTKATFENPAVPPMFCMLMRKHFIGARFISVSQPPMERVVDFSLLGTNELGDEVTKHLIIEIMGRNSNLIMTDEENRIIDCLRRVDYEMSEQRQVLPGLYYQLPPAQNKLNPVNVSIEEIAQLLQHVDYPVRPDSFIMDHFSGLPPIVCRELVFRFDESMEDVNLLSMSQRYSFAAFLKQEFSEIAKETYHPYLLIKRQKSWDFTYIPIRQYGDMVESIEQESFSELLDAFYSKRDTEARLKSKSQAIVKSVTNLRNRTMRKLQIQRKELTTTAERDTFRICGEIITANLYRMKRGATKLVAENYYDPDLREIEIRLDPLLTPQQNAAKYFKDYNKAKTAEIILTEQIKKGELELQYLESILDELSRVETEKDISEIRQELVSGGYIKNQDKKKTMKRQASKPMEFKSESGLLIRVGRNNIQNDELTLRTSFKSDLWLHTQKIHGSHVIISCEGKEPDYEAIVTAAKLAAWFSQGRDGQNVPVDYTVVKNVKKPNGAKPGMVIYDHYNTVYVTPEEELVNALRLK